MTYKSAITAMYKLISKEPLPEEDKGWSEAEYAWTLGWMQSSYAMSQENSSDFREALIRMDAINEFCGVATAGIKLIFTLGSARDAI